MIKTCIWFVMFLLAIIQNNNKLEFLIFEIIIYMLINILIKRKSVRKKPKSKYKYQNAIDEYIDYKNDECDEFNIDLFESQLSELENELNEYENKVNNYDYREFVGRKNIPWEDIYDYLWNQCRYKGIPMWIEYMNHLIDEGVMNKSDRIKVIRKAGDYIPWNPRLDLEAEQNDFVNEVRKSDKLHELESERNRIFNEKLLKDGVISNNEYEDYVNRRYKTSLEHLKNFYYEDYLKEIGKV